MKTICSIISSLLLMPLMALSQTDSDCCDEKKCLKSNLTARKITKGYYSIGNNIEKLASYKNLPCCPHKDSLITDDLNLRKPVTKGYYSISDNYKKLRNGTRTYKENSPKPVIRKGYYSIGNNAEKLEETGTTITTCCPRI